MSAFNPREAAGHQSHPSAVLPGLPVPPGRRILAYLIDAGLGVILGGIGGGIGAAVFMARGSQLQDLVLVTFIPMLLSLAWVIVYSVLQGRGASLGERWLGLGLADQSSGAPIGFARALLRNVVWGASCAIIVGYLTPAFDPSPLRQGWHDKVGRAVIIAGRTQPRAAKAGPAAQDAAAGAWTPPGGPPAAPHPVGPAQPVANWAAPPQPAAPQFGAPPQPVAPQFGAPPPQPAVPQFGAPPPQPAAPQPAAPQPAAPQPYVAPQPGNTYGPPQPVAPLPVAPQPVAPQPVAPPQPAEPAWPVAQEPTVQPTGSMINFVPGITQDPPVRADDAAGTPEVPAAPVAGHTVVDPFDAEPGDHTIVPGDLEYAALASPPVAPVAPEPVAPEPVPVSVEPIAPEPEPVAAEPVLPEPVVPEPAVAEPAPVSVEPVVAEPVVAEPVEPVSATTIVGEPEQDIFDETVIVRRSPARPTATLLWDDGTAHSVDTETLFGRNPSGDAPTLAVRDESRSLSKTHFAFGVDADGVWVTDLHSTNGVTVVRGGERIDLIPGTRTAVFSGDLLEMGDRTATVGGAG